MIFGYFDFAICFLYSIYLVIKFIKFCKRLLKSRFTNKIYYPPRYRVKIDDVFRYLCAKCGEGVAFVITKPTSAFSSMANAGKRKQLFHRLCGDCQKSFDLFESNAFFNSYVPPLGNSTIKLILLENFLKNNKLSIHQLLAEYITFDKDLKSAVEIYYNPDFEGDIFDMKDCALKLLSLV